METGIVVAFASSVVPQGWELCDGRMLDRTNPRYGPLFDVIGTTHGGDGAPRFQLPDYRGMFLRGVAGRSDRDPEASDRLPPGDRNSGNRGNLVGSLQGSQVGGHGHTVRGMHLEAQGGGGFRGAGLNSNSGYDPTWSHEYDVNPHVASETRPINAYVHFIIKL